MTPFHFLCLWNMIDVMLYIFFVYCCRLWIKYISVWWYVSPDCFTFVSDSNLNFHFSVFSLFFFVTTSFYHLVYMCIKSVITDLAGDVSLRLFFSSLGFSRSVVEALEASSGADRNDNYRPEPDALLFLSYRFIQTITLCAPEEAWCGFEYEWRLHCCVLEDKFYILQERRWRRTPAVQRKRFKLRML